MSAPCAYCSDLERVIRKRYEYTSHPERAHDGESYFGWLKANGDYIRFLQQADERVHLMDALDAVAGASSVQRKETL